MTATRAAASAAKAAVASRWFGSSAGRESASGAADNADGSCAGDRENGAAQVRAEAAPGPPNGEPSAQAAAGASTRLRRRSEEAFSDDEGDSQEEEEEEIPLL